MSTPLRSTDPEPTIRDVLYAIQSLDAKVESLDAKVERLGVEVGRNTVNLRAMRKGLIPGENTATAS